MPWYSRLLTRAQWHTDQIEVVKKLVKLRRFYSEVQTFKTEQGQIKVPLVSFLLVNTVR